MSPTELLREQDADNRGTPSSPQGKPEKRSVRASLSQLQELQNKMTSFLQQAEGVLDIILRPSTAPDGPWSQKVPQAPQQLVDIIEYINLTQEGQINKLADLIQRLEL